MPWPIPEFKHGKHGLFVVVFVIIISIYTCFFSVTLQMKVAILVYNIYYSVVLHGEIL